jgi:hypothetical protein
MMIVDHAGVTQGYSTLCPSCYALFCNFALNFFCTISCISFLLEPQVARVEPAPDPTDRLTGVLI